MPAREDAVRYPAPTHLFDRRQLTTDPAELLTYEVDAGFDRGQPDGVFFPESAEELSRMLLWAQEARVPLIARGAGTGLAGGAVAELGGIIVETSRMVQILELDTVGRTVVVEVGVVNQVLDAHVRQAGLYFPPDPSSGRSSLIGGNIATNAGGPHCFKYGVTTNYVLGLEVVLADGRIVTLGGRAADPPEYDFCGLMAGSEGTLGVLTRAELRLMRNPTGVKTMMVSFESEAQAGVAVSAVIAAGLVPATLELMDQRSLRMVEEYVHAGLPVDAGAALIVEVDGYPESLDAQFKEAADLLTEHGGHDLRVAQSEAERQQIWYGRKSAAGAFSRISPGYYLTDVTVPRSHLGEILAEINTICDRYNVRTANFFHAGDGNLHPLILCDPADDALMERVHRAAQEIIELSVGYDGSITGEHGVGIEKRQYMSTMYSGAELIAMREIKEVFDPHNLLNPGKVLPADAPRVDRFQQWLPDTDVFAPTSAQEAAGGLATCTMRRATVRIGGRADDRRGADIWLSTANLTGVLKFAPHDLYVSAGAGMPLADLQRFLAQHRMQVPLWSPWPDATLGGIVAGNHNGPGRMRYGSIRDLLLCATVALADGRVIRAGRPVVKNVAGYDLPKLMVGSFGTLGLLADLTFKLAPMPRARRTICVLLATRAEGLELARRLLPLALVASGIVVVDQVDVPGLAASPHALLYTAEGVAEDVAAELDEVSACLRRARAPFVVEVEPTAQEVWSKFLGAVDDETTLIRVGVPVKHLLAYEQMLPPDLQRGTRMLVDGAAGLLYAVMTTADRVELAQRLDALRRPAGKLGGYAIVVGAPAQICDSVDRWGWRPDALDLMVALKARWDPAGILNPGGFVVG